MPAAGRLCEECSRLIDHQDRIKVLSLTHSNVRKVLNEIEDIVGLPGRADKVVSIMDDPANLLPAFEALTVLEGIAENAKRAWNRRAAGAGCGVRAWAEGFRFQARWWLQETGAWGLGALMAL